MEFSQKVEQIVSHGWLVAGLSIGSRLGIFNELSRMAQSKSQAVTSQQLADNLNMKERYIREWIGGMVCGGIIDHVELEGTDRYWISADKSPTLVNPPDGMCVANSAELCAGAMSGYANVEACFHRDGPRGTEVDDYPILHEFLSKRTDAIFKTADQASALLVEDDIVKRLEQGIRVLEIGCGAAGPTRLMAKTYPESMFTASDLSDNVLVKARDNCKELNNVDYRTLDACNVPADLHSKYDLVILVDVLHDVAYPDKLIQGATQLLSTGGKFIVVDVETSGSLKLNKERDCMFWYMISTLYCTPTSLAHPGGMGLGACVGAPVLEKLLKDGGFKSVSKESSDYGLTFICTKD